MRGDNDLQTGFFPDNLRVVGRTDHCLCDHPSGHHVRDASVTNSQRRERRIVARPGAPRAARHQALLAPFTAKNGPPLDLLPAVDAKLDKLFAETTAADLVAACRNPWVPPGQ